MTDVESMEVLKGPGSALYGRNEPGGAINITTKKPLDHAHASVEGMVGFWNMHRLAADVGTPFIDNQLLTRMNVGYYKTDGYRGLSREIIEVLPTVTWKFTEKHALTLDYDFRNIKTRPDNYGILFDKNNNKLSAGSPSRTYYSPFNTAEQTINRISALYEGKFNEHLKLRSTLIYDDRSIFMVRNANVTVNTNDTVTNRDSRVQNDKIQTVLHQDEAVLKFNTGSWAHTVLAGFEFEYAKMNTARDSYKPLAAIGLSNPYPTESDYKSLPKTQNYDRLVELITTSAYAQEQVAFSKYVKARAGVRLDHVDASDKGIGTQPGNNTVQQRTISMARDLISYQAGLVYQPWEISSFYGGYSEGRYIAANTEAPYLYTEPETSSQLEFGNKLSLFKDKLQTNLAIFRTTRASYAFTGTNGNVNFLGGKRRTDGIELDVSGSPIAGLWIIFNSALMDSKVMTESTGTGVNAVDLAGKTPQNIP
ncbi:MAG TPA: TonB-dependent receptor, partial [Turneriella sp.]|nr:TonB-dependent receptor [Turneriella sp.]